MKKSFFLMAGILAGFAMTFMVSSCNKEEVITPDPETTGTAEFNKVYTYLPGPGQFINEAAEPATMEEAIAEAEKRLKSNLYVSLGGFGGFIVVGFDHKVKNVDGYDFGIYGNAFDGSSEPGIVWVMQDSNGDGLPNDTWYELRGSETGKAETIQDYAVTYFRPEGPKQPVKWKDNLGNEGEIDYLAEFHKQDYYYPAWVKEDSYTLKGTCLKARNKQNPDNGQWVQSAYDWGYADNFSAEDMLQKQGQLKGNANLFDIANAIDGDGKSVGLKSIDFIKVQNAVNAKSGWLGELSTEVLGFFDYSMLKK